MNRSQIEQDVIRDFIKQGRGQDVRNNTPAFRQATLEAFEAAGIQLTADETRELDGYRRARSRAARRPGRYAAGRMFVLGSSVMGAARAGVAAGSAVASVLPVLSHAVSGAASGFVAAGSQALNLFLSPWGKSGAAVSAVAGSLGKALIAALMAGGGLVSAGTRLGFALGGALIAGAGAGLSAGLGALVGSALGAGPLAGAMVGAGIFSSGAGLVGNLLGAVGGALGQALNAVGQAFGQLGRSIGDTLSSVRDVLADLIETGKKFGDATLAISRGGGLGLAASGQYAALGQILTGSPGGLSAFFGNFGTMAPYISSRAMAFGVAGVNANDPASLIGGAYRRYAALGNGPLGAVQRQILLQGLFPGVSSEVGGLFSMGGGTVGSVLSTMRATAMSPREAMQDARLGMNLSVVEAQITRIKTRFLTDLMPAISTGLSLFTKWFGQNEGRLLSGLESAGRWVYVQLPSVIKSAVDGFFGLGKTLLSLLPTVGALGQGFLTMMQTTVFSLQAVGRVAGGILGAVTGGDPLSRALSALGAMSNPITGQMISGFGDTMNRLAASGTGALGRGQAGFDRWYAELGLGSSARRAAQYDHYLQAAHRPRQDRLQVEIVQRPNEEALYRFEARILKSNAQQQVWAVQDAGD